MLNVERKIKKSDYLLIGLFILLFALWTYLTLSGKLHSFDLSVQVFVFSLQSPPLTVFCVALEYFGHWPIPTVVGLILLVSKKTRFSYGIPLACSIATSIGLYEAFKHIFKRARPNQILWLCNEHGFSYPSGHTLNNFVFWLTLASLLTYYFVTKGKSLPIYKNEHSTSVYPKSQGMMIFLRIVLILWPLVIGISRVYVGVHWPTDVLASMILSVAVLGIERIVFLSSKE